jgi:uncharacterized protein (TIGR03435 family)
MQPVFTAALLLLSAQPPYTFEVASVKPVHPGDQTRASLDAAHFTCSSMPLRSLIFSIYRIPYWRMSGGPAWLDSDLWDIAATLPPNMPANRDELTHLADLMVQALLADRFKLAVHREMRDLPVYELVVAKSASKLKPSSTDKFSAKIGPGRIELHHVSMAVFVTYLYFPPQFSRQVADRPVLDKTGLEGFFDLTFDWAPDTVAPNSTATGPSIYTALEEQTGLKLEPRKAPFEFLVIDHVEKPAEN